MSRTLLSDMAVAMRAAEDAKAGDITKSFLRPSLKCCMCACDTLAALRAEAEEVDQIAAAMRALEGADAGSTDGALEDDFVLAATTVCTCASTCCSSFFC